jgi:hypothetical protein
MTTPTAPSSSRPTQRFRVMLTPEDAELLESKARAAGLIPSALARALVLAGLRGTETPLKV